MATKSIKTRNRIQLTIMYIILTLVAFLAMLPLLYMISTSLKTYGQTVTRVASSPLDPMFWPKWGEFQFVNYKIAWNEGIGRYFLNSIIISSITTFGVFLTTIPSAFAFSKMKFPGRDTLFAILLTTLMIPETVLTIPNFLTVSSLGWMDKLPALTVPFIASAFYIFLLRQFFSQVPNALLEAARIDGASNFRSMISIAVPLARGPLFTIGFLAFTGAWNALQWPLVVTLTEQWKPLTVGLMKFLSEAGPESQLRMAGAAIALIPVVIVYIMAQKQITEAITRSGVKG